MISNMIPMWAVGSASSCRRFLWFVLVFMYVILDHQLHVAQCRVMQFKEQNSDVNLIKLKEGDSSVDLLRRIRRDSPDGGGSRGSGSPEVKPAQPPTGKQPDVTKTVLNDTEHNEAIVYWTGIDSSTVFVLTRQHDKYGTVPDSSLLRSTDYGGKFNPVDDKFPSGTVIRYFYSCPTNKKKIIFADTKNRRLFVTNNAGNDYKTQNPPISPDRLLFHPTDNNTVLLYNYRLRKLMISKDSGEHWKLVSDFVNPRFYWAVADIDNDNYTVHMEAQIPASGKYVYKKCTEPFTDCEPDEELGYIDVESIVVQDEYIFAQRSTLFSSDLLVSYNRGPFLKAYFPMENHNHPQDFHIVTTDDHQVFLVADHRENWVNLYLSDITGHYFTLSLRDVFASRSFGMTFDPDIYEVKGLKGIYIANVEPKGHRNGSVTLITFDQGGQWNPIPAPSNEPKCGSESSCNLNLHLSSSLSMPYILSEENAPGIILALGTVGEKLDREKSSLYKSSNGGLTWKKVFNGVYKYNILDQGGAMVAVNLTNSQKTNKILYSCTEGEDWKEYDFHYAEVEVNGIINEPGVTTLITSIYGHLDNKSGWLIAKVDFAPILSRQCEDTDYVVWRPSDDIKKEKHQCILGQELQYKRRKANATCANGHNYVQAHVEKACSCSDSDYECDYGYSWNQTTESCKAESWFNPDIPVGECPEGTKYNKSNGYRKIAADKCVGDEDGKQRPRLVDCPTLKPDDLEIRTQDGKLTVATNKPVVFELIQRKGSKMKTVYVWTFGDKPNHPTSVQGYDKGRTQSFTYRERGVVEVKVNATNKKGSTSVSMILRVEDEIIGLYVELPHGAKAGIPVKFVAEPVRGYFNSSDVGNTPILWSFGEEQSEEKPLLTYGLTVKHQYDKPGNYTASVEAMNSVSSVFKIISVVVYGTLTTVQLSFNEFTDQINQRNPYWRIMFADLLKKQLSEDLLEIPPERLEVVVLPGIPTKVDVSILPQKQDMTSDQTIQTIVGQLQNLVDTSRLNMDVSFLETRFPGLKAQAVKAEILHDIPDIAPSSRDYTAVYVCVPILIAAVFVSVLVILYYKKKLTSYRRYSILQSHSSAEAEDTLLGDDDDDDPILDPNPDNQGSLGDDEEFDIGQFGRPPALVMMTGTNNDDTQGSVNC